jgi:hypothetical protein
MALATVLLAHGRRSSALSLTAGGAHLSRMQTNGDYLSCPQAVEF